MITPKGARWRKKGQAIGLLDNLAHTLTFDYNKEIYAIAYTQLLWRICRQEINHEIYWDNLTYFIYSVLRQREVKDSKQFIGTN